ncbi:MAG: family 43 glycosylhydrolase [Anaerolineae bacterium]|nr:family 43 glycosylhydrolase [Anaerolineae bacterium]
MRLVETTLSRVLIVALLLLLTVGVVQGQSDDAQPGTLRNPLNLSGPDPWLVYYEGHYYLAATTWSSVLTMRKAPTLAGLKTATPEQIYFETDPSRCCNMWAPEFNLLDGPNGPRWYFYYSAGTADTLDNQHTHVLESAGTDPMGPYSYKGRLYDPANDTWAIDGGILKRDDKLYFLFSAFIQRKQNLFIAPMSDPWTISGPRVSISEPEYPWETIGGFVNEGPAALYHDDRVFIIYSASACSTPDYQLGMLTYNGGDPMSPDSWVKSPEPVFERSDENGVFGPGHNGFFKSPDGTEDWIVYHANDSAAGGCDMNRTTRVQKFTWNDDGTPNFGVPVSTEEEIAAPSGDNGVDPLPVIPRPDYVRFQSYGNNAFLRHRNFQLRLDLNPTPLADSQFIAVPGLADSDAASFEAANYPGYYLRHQNNLIVLAPDDGSDTFAGDATWTLSPGLADETWISFESYSQPGSYIGQKFGVMALVKLEEMKTDRAREDATFQQVD